MEEETEEDKEDKEEKRRKEKKREGERQKDEPFGGLLYAAAAPRRPSATERKGASIIP